MSEYQYFEFLAVDRPLTQAQMSDLRLCSSRAQITPSSFVNVYNWGNFKGNPDKWMEKYFDAFLYLSNWGSRWLMLRVPKQLLDPDTASTYKSLVGKERGLWGKVGKLIATKQPKRNDEAVALLIDLKDLADMKGKSSGFSLRMIALCSKHTRKTTLVDRFRKAKLLR